MKVSLASQFNSKTKTITLASVDELLNFVTTTSWCPSIFNPETRANKNFKSTELLVFDVDNGLSLDGAKEVFAQYKSIIATTRSHQKDKGGIVADRYRVILFLKELCTTKAKYDATWIECANKWPFVDAACKDTSRFYFPCINIVSVVDGALLELSNSTIAERQYTTVPREYNFIPASVSFVQKFGVPEGKRNDTLFKVSCDIFRCGYTVDEAVEMLYGVSSLSDRELLTCIRSAYKTVSL